MSWRAPAAAAVLAALTLWAAIALERRTAARAAYRHAAAAAALPRLSASSGRLIAPTLARARAGLAQRIGDAGAAAGVRLSLASPPDGETVDGSVTLRIVARGDEPRLLRFAASVEQGAPLIRWTRWSIRPDGDGALRLGADAAAPWAAR